jgi:AAA ATPase domain
MKFTFRHLGAIDEATVELAPLTIICGRNNTGKTYVTYAIHALLSTWRQLIPWTIARTDMNALLQGGIVSIDLQEKFVSMWDDTIATMNQKWQQFLPVALAAPKERFEKTELSFELEIGNEWKAAPFEKEFRSEEGKILFSVKKVADSSIVDCVAVKDDQSEFPRYAIEDFVNQALVEAVLGTYIPTVFMVSTERTGAVTFKDELNLTKNKIVNFLAKMESSSDAINPGQLFEAVYKRGYPLPVENNVQFVNRLGSLESRRGELVESHPQLEADFELITGGRYETSKDGVTHFVPNGAKTKLQLSEASSAVRSLVVFWYWLRTQARKGQLLVIDEPELNLHPENQRAFARFLVRLVNFGVHVLITTHSDTMVREFNTLLMFGRDLPHASDVRDKFGYGSEEKLLPDQIRLYVANGKPRTPSGRSKNNARSTLLRIDPDTKLGLAADIFDSTIIEMNKVQDALRYGAA